MRGLVADASMCLRFCVLEMETQCVNLSYRAEEHILGFEADVALDEQLAR